MGTPSFFRTEALNANNVKWLGDVVLVRPISFLFLTLAAVGMSVATVSFLLLGSYTKRSAVAGQLSSDVGVIKVYAAQPGIVVQKKVHEGQAIKKGDVLYVVSSERQGNNSHGIQATISQQVALRKQSLVEEMSQTRKLQRDDEDAVRKKIDGLLAEQANVIHQIAGQNLRVELADAALGRATRLLGQGYISSEMAQQKQADLLDQQNRLQALQRDQISGSRELISQRAELDSLPLRHQNQLAQLERILTSTEQEWTESEGKRRIVITAPDNGIATAVTAEVGQTVDGTKPMVSVIPGGAVLEAHLYAPSRAIGFVRPNDPVLLRYQAFPYQKFGHARGRVSSVSRVALASHEVAGLQNSTPTGGESLYRITVSLESQAITAYGKPQRLQIGMLVDADILLEERNLYEWVLEPLYSMTGKL